jgi:peptidoglycan/LPS O-acetylase OafA/YrhL
MLDSPPKKTGLSNRMAIATQTAEKTAPSRVTELDGIRGIAILLVMLSHFGVPAAPHGLLHNILGFGWVGVDLFFALSGYLITGILLDSPRENYFSRFYGRRILRIFPVYYAFIIVFFHILPVTSGRAEEPWYLLYLANWRDIAHQRRSMYHFWSLCIEEQFYLIWPLTLYFFSRKHLKFLCAGIIVLCPVLRYIALGHGISADTVYRATCFRMEGLAWGSLLALAARDQSLRDAVKRSLPWLSGAALLTMAAVLWRWGTVDTQSAGVQIYGYSSVAILATALVFNSSKVAGYLSDSRLLTLGKYSYGLYVWQMPIAEKMKDYSQAHSGWLMMLACWAVGIAASFAVALLSWAVIERPFLKLKDSLFRPAASNRLPQPSPALPRR